MTSVQIFNLRYLNSSVGYIVGARAASRFKKIDAPNPAPNAYFKGGPVKPKSAKYGFNAKGYRFPEQKIQQMPSVGSYNVTEDFGRHVERWRKAPDELKCKKSAFPFHNIENTIIFCLEVEKEPCRSMLVEQREIKRYHRRLDYLSLYY